VSAPFQSSISLLRESSASIPFACPHWVPCPALFYAVFLGPGTFFLYFRTRGISFVARVSFPCLQFHSFDVLISSSNASSRIVSGYVHDRIFVWVFDDFDFPVG